METGWQRFALRRQLNPLASPSQERSGQAAASARYRRVARSASTNKVGINPHPLQQRASRLKGPTRPLRHPASGTAAAGHQPTLRRRKRIDTGAMQATGRSHAGTR
jgi:hypothetical protein